MLKKILISLGIFISVSVQADTPAVPYMQVFTSDYEKIEQSKSKFTKLEYAAIQTLNNKMLKIIMNSKYAKTSNSSDAIDLQLELARSVIKSDDDINLFNELINKGYLSYSYILGLHYIQFASVANNKDKNKFYDKASKAMWLGCNGKVLDACHGARWIMEKRQGIK